MKPSELSVFACPSKDAQTMAAGLLNGSPVFKALSVECLVEDGLDIEFQVRKSMQRQGVCAMFETPELRWQGHSDGEECWQCRLVLDVVENPSVWRPAMKRLSADFGTGLDLASYAQRFLGGYGSPTRGAFCPVAVEQGEENGLVVCRSSFDVLLREPSRKVFSGWEFSDGKEHSMELVQDGAWYWEADGGIGDLWHVDGQEYDAEEEGLNALSVLFEDRSKSPSSFVTASRESVIA